MAVLTFNDVTKHKLIPITGVIIYSNITQGSVTGIELKNVMKESNIIIDPITARTGYGGERMIAVKFKVSIYFNSTEHDFQSALDELAGTAGYYNGTYSVPDGRVPIFTVYFGKNYSGYAEKELSFWFGDCGQLSYSWVTADGYGKFGLVLTGVMRNLNRLADA